MSNYKKKFSVQNYLLRAIVGILFKGVI